MHTGLLHLHSFLRWVLLLLLIASIIKTYSGWKSRKSFNPGDRKLPLFTMITAHIQLVLGLTLYMISPVVQSALSDMGTAMKVKELRFWSVEHILVMVIAIGVITAGYMISKKTTNEILKFRRIFIYYTIALLIILITIPWPFMEIGAGRGWF
jgi:hypothetical protein